MMQKNLPFNPFPLKVTLGLANKFKGIGNYVANMFPFLKTELNQAEIDITAEIYGAVIIMLFFIYSVFGTLVTYAFVQKLAPEQIILAPVIGLVFGVLTALQLLLYPKIVLKKKVRNLERNLVFALRTLLVEIRSGVTLFDAINIVANGDNGQVSKELKKAVEKIETGKFQNDALEEMGENNPSLYFRRTIWQLVNGLKAGSDLSTIMESLVHDMSREKSNQVKRYGNSLKILSLLYMMLGAIIPSLGLTFLIILSTFPQIAIEEWIFWGMMGFIGVGQFMYLGIIKSSRPTLMGD